jgi:hypothetical protein
MATPPSPTPSAPFTLFLCKKRQEYGNQSYNNSLVISGQMLVSMLQLNGHPAALEEAVDQNCIHKFVLQYKPSVVVIEAIWVTPVKFKELQKLSPQVKWVVRINSEVPFLAAEGNSISWIQAYLTQGITMAFNSETALADFQVFAGMGTLVYLPNYYKPTKVQPPGGHNVNIQVGCFGAVRQMKNQLEQAFAAVKYGKLKGRPVSFHMNKDKVEQGNEGIIPTVRSVLELTGNELILNPWLGHKDFLALVRSMDICLQCSFSESFNMCAADSVSVGVPTVGSPAVRWLPRVSQVNPASSNDIVAGMLRAGEDSVAQNHAALVQYTQTTVGIWNTFLGWS